MKNIRYCRNHYGGKTEYCLLIEKRTARNILGLVIGAVLAQYWLLSGCLLFTFGFESGAVEIKKGSWKSGALFLFPFLCPPFNASFLLIFQPHNQDVNFSLD